MPEEKISILISKNVSIILSLSFTPLQFKDLIELCGILDVSEAQAIAYSVSVFRVMLDEPGYLLAFTAALKAKNGREV